MNERLAIYTLARVPKMGEIRRFSGVIRASAGEWARSAPIGGGFRLQRRDLGTPAREKRRKFAVDATAFGTPRSNSSSIEIGNRSSNVACPLDLGGGDLIGNRNIPLPRLVCRRLIERLGADKDDALHARPSAGALADERVGPARIPQPTRQSIPTSKIRPTGVLNMGVGRYKTRVPAEPPGPRTAWECASRLWYGGGQSAQERCSVWAPTSSDFAVWGK